MTEARRRRIVVQFGIGDREVAGFDYAAPRILGPRDALVYEATVDAATGEPLPGAGPTVHMFFDGDDLEEARESAIVAYRAMRELAQLDPDEPPHIIGTYPAISLADDEWADWLDDAYELHDQQRHGLAVVAAQVACELQIQRTIQRAIGNAPSPVELMTLDVPRSFSLLDSIGPRLFRAALGVKPTTFPSWTDYKLHVNRRNLVLHRGADLDGHDATASLVVVDLMGDWLRELLARRPAAQ